MNNFFNVLLIFALITESGNFQNKRKEQILKNIIAVIRDVRVEMQQFIEQFFRPFLPPRPTPIWHLKLLYYSVNYFQLQVPNSFQPSPAAKYERDVCCTVICSIKPLNLLVLN